MEDEHFGVILILPPCAFTAELDRDTMETMMKGIDDTLTEQGAPEEAETRSTMMMQNALIVAEMLSSGEIEQMRGYNDIAYSFVYAFGKAVGFDQMATIRGMTGSLIRNRLRLNPCLNEVDYQQESAYFVKRMADHEESGDDEWDIEFMIPPTLH